MSDKLKIIQEKRIKPHSRSRTRPVRSRAEDVQVVFIHSTVIQEVNSNPWGIDVSHHNGAIDWPRIHAAGVGFAFMKATEGASFVDSTFKRNFALARANGILVGAYHFFQPKVAVSRQVDNFVRAFGTARDGDLPPVLDVEDPSLWAGITKAQAVERVVGWIEGVRAKLGSHVNPIIYTSPSFAQEVLGDDKRLADNPLWLAHYTTASRPRVPLPWKYWTFWQHSESGRVSGISGAVDLNRFNGDRSRLNALTMTNV